VAAAGGRYERGQQRRDALVEAAAELLLTSGRAALSHRAVAAHAGLPLASTTYYFASAQDLGDAALQRVAEQFTARAAAVVEALPDRLDAAQAAHAVGAVIGADLPRDQLLLMYERYLEAGRHPRLRELVVSWNARVKELIRLVLLRAGLPADDGTAALVLAAADGAAVTALAEGGDCGPTVATTVEAVLDRL
jgi:DNA-binding transcriptional regulator YbjK